MTLTEPQTCDVRGCDQPAVVLLANYEPLTSPEYREWYACRWHRRNDMLRTAALRSPDADA